jgi:hypothetical protein
VDPSKFSDFSSSIKVLISIVWFGCFIAGMVLIWIKPAPKNPEKPMTAATTTGAGSPVFQSQGPMTVNYGAQSEEELRPRFVIVSAEVKPGLQGYQISTDCTNGGKHGMANTRGILIIDNLDGLPQYIRKFDYKGDVWDQNAPRNLFVDGILGVTENTKPCYVTRFVRYEDATTGKTYDQTFFLKWPGTAGGRGRSRLELTSAVERAVLEKKYLSLFAEVR